MIDQAERLRRLVKRKELGVDVQFSDFIDSKTHQNHKTLVFLGDRDELAAQCNLIANCAASVAAMKRRVMLLDATSGVVDCGIPLGIRQQTRLSDILASSEEEVSPVSQGAGSVMYVKMGDVLDKFDDYEYTVRQRFYQQWGLFEDASDIMFIYETEPRCSYTASDVVIITSPGQRMVTSAYERIKNIARQCKGIRIGLIVNTCLTEKEGAAVARQLVAAAKKFLDATVYDLGSVVLTPEVVKALKAKSLFLLKFPFSKSSNNVTAVSQRMMRMMAARPLAEAV